MKCLFRSSGLTCVCVLSIFLTPRAWAGPDPLPPVEMTPAAPDSPWHVEFLPYLWTANLNGTVGVKGVTSGIDVGFDDVLDNLDFAGSALTSIRYNRIGLLTDIIYVKVSPSFSMPGSLFQRTDLTMEQTIVDLKGTYRILENDKGWLDLIGGARYMNMDLDFTLKPGRAPASLNAAGSDGWWDAVGGIRTRYHITDRIFFTGIADAGGGSSDITWQVGAGLGYRFTDRFHMAIDYRYMDYDYKNGGFTYDVATQGIGLGFGFTF